MLSADTLAGLAPPALVNYRSSRYNGDSGSLTPDRLHPDDRAIAGHLYSTLTVLLQTAGDDSLSLAERRERLAQTASAPEWSRLIAEAQMFGTASLAGPPDPLLAHALHDLRGGALTALAGRMDWLALGRDTEDQVTQVFLLARDHLKIMRNILPGIDDTVRADDEAFKLHSIDLITQKWANASLVSGRKHSVMTLHSSFDGNIAERCLEMSSLDRVLYNLLNNAARHNAGVDIALHIVPLPGSPDLRFVVANTITPHDRERLAERFGDTVSALFQEHFTTTGSGLGLKICADFVANAYGIGSTARLLQGGYIGAIVQDDVFITWFHWPVAAD